MSGCKVTILPIARDDLNEIYLYIAAENPEAALQLVDRILDRIDALADFPLTGRIVPDGELAKRDYRMLVIEKYVVFYRVIDDTALVYRVLHGARDYPYLLM